jgi:molybdopterin synthase catalytic subunit
MKSRPTLPGAEPTPAVIADTGPLLLLHAADALALVPELFGQTVAAEIARGIADGLPGQDLAAQPRFHIVDDPPTDARLTGFSLDRGELMAMSLALRSAEPAIVLIDERRGRHAPARRGGLNARRLRLPSRRAASRHRLRLAQQARYAGAIASFIGVVRDHHHARSAIGLHYECHEPLAFGVLRRLAEALRALHGALDLIVTHAVGDLAPGDAAIAIYVCAAHRRAELAACAEAIEAIKRDLPVWKREHDADGSAAWMAGS